MAEPNGQLGGPEPAGGGAFADPVVAGLLGEYYDNSQTALVWLTRPNGTWRIEHANPSAARLLGVTGRDELHRLEIPEAPHPGGPTSAPTGGELLGALRVIVDADGFLDDTFADRLRPRFTARRFEAAGMTGVLIAGRPGDLIREARRTFEAAQRLMSTYFRYAEVEAFMKDLEGRYLIVNENFTATYDTDGTGLLGRTDFEIIDADLAQRHRAEDEAVMRTLGPITVESAEQRPDGTHVFRLVKFPMFDDAGKLMGVGGVAADITAEATSRAALAISEEQFRLAFVHASEGIAILGLDGEILQVNDKLCDLLGRSRDELVGHTGGEFYHPDETAGSDEWIADVQHRGHAAFERTLVRPDGTPVFLRVSTAAVHNAYGEQLHYVAMCADETERVALETRARQAEKLEAVGQLAGGIAHDINNLLGGILGYAELVKAAQTDPVVADQCEQVIAAALRAADYTSRLLTFARPTDQMGQRFDLHELIGEVAHLLRHHRDPAVRVLTELRATDATVRGNPTQMHGALLNLAMNARDAVTAAVGTAHPQRSGSITFRTHDAGRDGMAMVAIEVADTGIGISPEAIARIFDPFFTTKSVGRGTGLGLTSVLAAVHHHEGTIDVTSTPGSGSTFSIVLPLAEPDDSEPLALDEPDLVVGTRAVVVDDDPAVRHVVAKSLRLAGCLVTEAGNGAAALAAIEEADARGELPEVVVFDLRMPGVDGTQLFAALTARWPRVATVLMSGFDGDEGAENLRRAGVGAVLQKPFKAADLVSTLARVIAPRQ